MPSLTIKNIPDPLLRRLRRRAAADRRSLNQELLHLLERCVDEPEPAAPQRRSEAAAQAEAWSRLAGSWISDLPVEEEVRAIYEHRTAGRGVEL